MDSGFKVLEKLLQTAQVRHRIISSNIANVDTPRYRAKDVDFSRTLGEESAGLRATHLRHIKAAPAGTVAGATVSMIENQSWGDDNNVELDIEVAKMTENGLLYEAGVKLLSKKIAMMKNALARR
jgi:flagellar basal-body rod protein FlgB